MHPTSVLLVDGDSDERNLLTLCLLQENFRVFPVSSGWEALRITLSEIDFVLTAAQVGEGITGVELAERITAAKPSIHVLLMLGLRENELLLTTKGFPAITKPFTTALLIDRIRGLMDIPPDSRTEPTLRRMSAAN